MNGLAPQDCYAEDNIRDIIGDGAFHLPEYHRLKVQAFNYKVNKGVSGRAYGKLPRAFPERLSGLPMGSKLTNRAEKILTYVPRSVHCCANSCMAFTGGYKDLAECP